MNIVEHQEVRRSELAYRCMRLVPVGLPPELHVHAAHGVEAFGHLACFIGWYASAGAAWLFRPLLAAQRTTELVGSFLDIFYLVLA